MRVRKIQDHFVSLFFRGGFVFTCMWGGFFAWGFSDNFAWGFLSTIYSFQQSDHTFMEHTTIYTLFSILSIGVFYPWVFDTTSTYTAQQRELIRETNHSLVPKTAPRHNPPPSIRVLQAEKHSIHAINSNTWKRTQVCGGDGDSVAVWEYFELLWLWEAKGAEKVED